jgi:predicted alpha/beta hydrolase
LLGHFPGERIGFGGRQPRTLMQQWARFCREGRIELAIERCTDWRDRLQRLPQRVAALHVRGDRYAPRGSIAHLLGEAGVDALPDEADIGGSPGHFGWLRDCDGIARQVVRFAAGVRPVAPTTDRQ